MAPAALGMNADIAENTVDFTPNYDNKLQEPTVLPAAIPNLLVAIPPSTARSVFRKCRKQMLNRQTNNLCGKQTGPQISFLTRIT